MSSDSRRIRSWEVVKEHDLPVNPNLPPVEGTLRSASALVDRALCLCSAVAVAYGFPTQQARSWLNQERLSAALAPSEQALLAGDRSQVSWFQNQTEALFALVWLLGLAEDLPLLEGCPDDLVHRFPDLKRSESSSRFREAASPQPEHAVLQKLDLIYCTHWALVEARLQGRLVRQAFPGLLERRHAIEWAVGADEWDEVSLDT